jgi:hypothetical protein
MSSLNDLIIGSSRKKVKIVKVESKKFAPEDRNDRIYVHTCAEDGTPYKVSEIWLRNHKGSIEVKGLWLKLDESGQILKNSLLARLMSFLKANKISDMTDKEVYLEPKENGFMAIVTYE